MSNVADGYVIMNLKLLIAFNRQLHCNKVSRNIAHCACAEVLCFPPVRIAGRKDMITFQLPLVLHFKIIYYSSSILRILKESLMFLEQKIKVIILLQSSFLS